jgi:hypothetical protein
VTPALDPTHDWATEIGRLVIAFGSIEHVTMMCLRQLPRDPIYKATSRLHLAPRIDLLCAILSESDLEADKRLLEGFQRARDLADKRNLIVHNPLILDVYKHDGGSRLIKKSIKSLRSSDKHVTFSDLRLARNEAEALAVELYAAAAAALEFKRSKPTPRG